MKSELQTKRYRILRMVFFFSLVLLTGVFAGYLEQQLHKGQWTSNYSAKNGGANGKIVSVEQVHNITALHGESIADTEEEEAITYPTRIQFEENIPEVAKPINYTTQEAIAIIKQRGATDERYLEIADRANEFPGNLLVDLAKNPEMLEFVYDYPNGAPEDVGLTDAELALKCPLFLQWDKRWGYEKYGSSSCIAVSGCGPTSLAMAVVALTDLEVTPAEIGTYAMANNLFLNGSGTMWKLMTAGAAHYGVTSTQNSDRSTWEDAIYECLGQEGVVVVSVGKGDFTTAGHFIVIYDYDENGFYVNDPFCYYRSSKQWTYEQLKKQMKMIWLMSA